jgi:alpha-L-fucosidase
VDVRFTAKRNVVYAVCMAWPERDLLINALGKRGLLGQTVEAVRMLGASEAVKWHQSDHGLALSVPREKPCRHAFVYRVDLKAEK